MSYEFYKILHLVSILVFFGSLGAIFYSSGTVMKHLKILIGVTSLFIFVAGMGLIIKGLGIGHGEKWPIWLWVKIIIWLLLAAGSAILSKRLKKHRVLAYYVMVFLGAISAVSAVLKFE